MFCTNCGKEIIDTAKFCNFCGRPQSAPLPQPISEQPVSGFVYLPEDTEPRGVFESAGTPEEKTAESAAAANGASADAEAPRDGVPTPNLIPSYGESSGQPAYPPEYTGCSPAPVIPAQPKPAVKAERKYTLGHIIMCLTAVAVMAIAAGVFAGLYFSVV